MKSPRNSRALPQAGWPLACLVLLLHTSAAWAQNPSPSDEDIFNKVFKKSQRPKVAQIPLPVFYENNKTPIGVVQAKIGDSGELAFDSKQIIAALEKLIEAPLSYRPVEIHGSELQEMSQDQDWLPIERFQNLPYKVIFDEKKLELRIEVPPEIRKKGTISISGQNKWAASDEKLESPVPISSFLNLRANDDFQYGTGTSLDGRKPLRGAFLHALNVNDYVLESNLSYYEQPGGSIHSSWRRGDVRVTRDFPEKFLRGRVGDLQYPVRGYQRYLPMAGISLSSNFSMDRSRLTVPGGNQELFLKRPSKVEIWVNDTLRETLELPAGPHELRDFPLISGLNDLKIDITNDLGETETIELSYFSANQLLAPGINEVNYSAGMPWISNGTGRSYEPSQLTASLFHRRGITDSLTLGANLQLSPEATLAGGEALWGNELGLFKIEPALSAGTGFGVALRTSYQAAQPVPTRGFAGSRTFALYTDSRSPNFSILKEANSTSLKHQLGATYGLGLSDTAHANLNFSYTVNRKTELTPQDAWAVNLGINNRWKAGPSASVQLQEQKLTQGGMESSLSFYLSWNFREDHQQISAGYNVKDDSMRLNWNYNPPESGTGATNARAAVRRNLSSRSFEAGVDYVANRALVSVGHTSTRQERPILEGGPVNLTEFNTQVATALVYAGGKFALSRPVNDAFAIIAPGANLEGQAIKINPRKKSYEVRTDFLGAAAATELMGYTQSSVKINAKDLPLNSGVTNELFYFNPRYRSGYLVKLGGEVTSSMAAKIFLSAGKPVSQSPGQIKCLSDTGRPPVTFFTSRTGKTRVEGLVPGKYELRFFDPELPPFIFDIPENHPELLDLGNVILGGTPGGTQ